jgi:polyferredoxin
MQDPSKQAKWRVRTWLVFSVVFFSQLLLGILGFDRFLMTGELHLPIPMMIIGGAVFRAEFGFMPVLFLSTVILSGPAWCSHLCYFGAFDAAMSQKKPAAGRKWRLSGPFKISVLILVLLVALILRLFNISALYTTIIASVFGLAGLGIIFLVSPRKGRMMHCIHYCPIGTLVNYLKYANPFRFRIDDTCTACMRCTSVCRYDALEPENISNRKPGITCTLCGDCIAVCRPGSFYYKFPGLNAEASRNLYLGVTVTLHAVFLALARI